MIGFQEKLSFSDTLAPGKRTSLYTGTVRYGTSLRSERVVRCTVECLIRDQSISGAIRRRAKITTRTDEISIKPPNLVQRSFHGDAAEPSVDTGHHVRGCVKIIGAVSG